MLHSVFPSDADADDIDDDADNDDAEDFGFVVERNDFTPPRGRIKVVCEDAEEAEEEEEEEEEEEVEKVEKVVVINSLHLFS